jgi:hypothetical protein
VSPATEEKSWNHESDEYARIRINAVFIFIRSPALPPVGRIQFPAAEDWLSRLLVIDQVRIVAPGWGVATMVAMRENFEPHEETKRTVVRRANAAKRCCSRFTPLNSMGWKRNREGRSRRC